MMKARNSTRVKAPANTNQPSLPTNLLNVVKDDAPPPKLNIRRDGADNSDGKMALLTTEESIGIGTWNVRTLHQQGNLKILLKQMDNFQWEVLGISETH